VGDLASHGVGVGVDLRLHLQPALRGRRRNKVDDDLVGDERLPFPVLGDEGGDRDP
jgi:hypothetical protein